ncbi:hypothetical protein TNCT_141611 [Trichonephila clavata]|uniref:Uncharacterized protein n=1 Tax=Trichonephila clavata TaxID=2740835 RepID=A0A8X6H1M1_TRICU|nr:hypothetical protein TNCT_141611 [Trichonephila clavata]
MENLLDEMDLSPPHSRPGTPPTDHNGTTEETPCQRLIQREHEEICALLENVVSDFGSIPKCTTLGFPLHTSPANTPTHTPKASPPGTPRSLAKRHNDGFITPPASKAARKVLLKTPGMAQVS